MMIVSVFTKKSVEYCGSIVKLITTKPANHHLQQKTPLLAYCLEGNVYVCFQLLRGAFASPTPRRRAYYVLLELVKGHVAGSRGH